MRVQAQGASAPGSVFLIGVIKPTKKFAVIFIMISESFTHSEILRLFGEIEDHRTEEILELNPSPDDLEVTAAYVAGLDDVMGKERLPLAGKAAKIYEIVTRDESLGEDEYPRD